MDSPGPEITIRLIDGSGESWLARSLWRSETHVIRTLAGFRRRLGLSLLAIPGPTTVLLVVSYALGHGRKHRARDGQLAWSLGEVCRDDRLDLLGLGALLADIGNGAFTILKMDRRAPIWFILGIRLWRAPVGDGPIGR